MNWRRGKATQPLRFRMSLLCLATYSFPMAYLQEELHPCVWYNFECTNQENRSTVSLCSVTPTGTFSSPSLLPRCLTLKEPDAEPFHTFKIHIANQPRLGSDRILHSRYPHINNCSSFFDHISCDQVGYACKKKTESNAHGGAKQPPCSPSPHLHVMSSPIWALLPQKRAGLNLKGLFQPEGFYHSTKCESTQSCTIQHYLLNVQLQQEFELFTYNLRV